MKRLEELLPDLYRNSKPIYDWIVKNNSTTKSRLLIDLCMNCQLYELKEFLEVVWITSAQYPTDAMTKNKLSNAFI